jgi:hypothetical protein
MDMTFSRPFLCFLTIAAYATIPSVPRETYAYFLPDTGQMDCYDNAGKISCPNPGERFYGQDAQYHGYQPAFIDNGDGTCSDLNTELIWQKVHRADELPQMSAFEYCQDDLELGGNSNWRVPSIRELISIVDYSQYDPAIDEGYFPNTASDYFFTH